MNSLLHMEDSESGHIQFFKLQLSSTYKNFSLPNMSKLSCKIVTNAYYTARQRKKAQTRIRS